MADASVKMQLNFKTPGGALLNLYGASKEELETQLDDLADLIPRILEVEKLASAVGTVQNTFSGATSAPQAAQNVNSQGPGPAWAGSPQNAAPGGAPEVRNCIHSAQHGPMRWVERPEYKGFFCPLPKNSMNADGTKANCKPQYIR